MYYIANMSNYRRHKIPLTGIRLPEDVKADLKEVSDRYKISMNDIVVSAVKDKLIEIKKKKPII